MAFKFTKNNKNNNRLVKDDRIVDDPKGQGLVKKSGKVDNLLINRKGLINGPPAQKQDVSLKKVKKEGKGKKRTLASILRK